MFPSGFPAKTLCAFSSPLCVLHEPPITLPDLITLIKFGEAQCYEATHYAVFSASRHFLNFN